MRRIISACLLQTMRFDTTKEADPEQDFAIFCKRRDKSSVNNDVVHTALIEPFTEDGKILIRVRLLRRIKSHCLQ